VTEQLEDQLTRVLNDRARAIETAPAYRLVPEAVVATRRPRTSRPRATRRISWPVIASAAAVAALVALVVVLANGWAGSRRSAPTLNGAQCNLAQSAAFSLALRGGRLPVGSRVLSGDSDGTSLVSVEQAGVTTAVELISRSGAVHVLWRASAGDRLRAVANPSGSITPDAAVFVLDPEGSGTPRVMFAFSTDATAQQLDPLAAGYRVSTDPLTAPIIMSDGIVEALSTSTALPSQQRIDDDWPPTGNWSINVQRISGVARMVPVGGNTELVLERPDGTVDLVVDPTYTPTTLPPAAHNGFGFVSDVTTMTWFTVRGGQATLWHWAAGDPAPIRKPLPAGLTPVRAAGQYAVVARDGARGILDTATGVLVQLPSGVDLMRVDGGFAVLTQETPDGVRYSRVPVALLTTC